jgi:hypothetical protein
MASIDSMAFDAAAYTPGQMVNLTVGYTPDSPSVTSQTFTATAQIADPSGNVLATSAAPFVVNTASPSGDKVSVSDDGNHTWADVSDSGTVAVFSTQA